MRPFISPERENIRFRYMAMDIKRIIEQGLFLLPAKDKHGRGLNLLMSQAIQPPQPPTPTLTHTRLLTQNGSQQYVFSLYL